MSYCCQLELRYDVVNSGDGEVRTSSSRQLMSGIARFDEKLVFTAVIGFDEETQKYHELKVFSPFNLVDRRDINNH
jgi:hypothetical protein